MLSCLPCGQADPVDRAIKEAENLRNRDRQRINREIEKGSILFQTTFNRLIIKLIMPYTKHQLNYENIFFSLLKGVKPLISI